MEEGLKEIKRRKAATITPFNLIICGNTTKKFVVYDRKNKK
jgi:hypothetical protein